MKKKAGRVLLIGMLLIMLCISAEAADKVASGYCYGSTTMTWELDADGTLSVSGTGELTNPADKTKVPWNGYISQIKRIVVAPGITQIGKGAFHGCSSVTEVILPESVSVIGEWAFGECDKLTDIILPEGLTSIGASAFYGCDALSAITIPTSVRTLGDWAFGWCASLKDLKLSAGELTIGSNAFYKCDSLVMVWLPEQVKLIGAYSFAACSNLRIVVFQGDKTGVTSACFGQNSSELTLWGHAGIGAQKYAAAEGVKFAVLGQGDTYFSGTCTDGLYWAISEKGVFRLYGNGVMGDYTATKLVPWLHFEPFINEIYIGDGVTGLDDDVFMGYPNVTRVTLGRGLTDVGAHSFSACPKLTGFVVPEENTVYSGAEGALYSKDGTVLYRYPAGREETEFAVPAAVTALESSALRGCGSLTQVTLHENLTRIGDAAFYGCTGLTSMMIPETVTEYGANVFTGCSGLEWLDIRGNMEELCAYEFRDCGSLSWVRFPATVMKAEARTFEGASALQKVIFTGSAPLLSDSESGGYFGYYGSGTVSRRSVYFPEDDLSWASLHNTSQIGFIPYRPGKLWIDKVSSTATCAPGTLADRDAVMKIAVYDGDGRMVSFRHCLYTAAGDAPVFHMMLGEEIPENHTVTLFWVDETTWMPLSCAMQGE